MLQNNRFPLNKIAARWPAKAVAQFSLTTNKSSGSTFRNSVLLSYHTKQLNTESSTAYENNSIYRRLPQSELSKEITEQLESGVAAVFESDAYKA